MSIVLNRTDKRIITSVNTPDYPIEDWIINPDLSSVNGVPNKYLKITGDVVTEMDQSEKDDVDAADSNANPRALILDLTPIGDKDHISLDYSGELNDGIRLHKEESFTKEGLIDVVTYYNGWVDSGNKGTEILKVEHTWTVDEVETIPAAANIISRVKLRKWMADNNDYHPSSKTTTKIYDTAKKVNDEGVRRRGNVVSALQTGIVTILLVTGTSPNQADAEDKLIATFEEYNSGINTYVKSGKGSIYDDINADSTFTWFDTLVGATAEAILGLPSDWDTKDIREYIVEKLKGNI